MCLWLFLTFSCLVTRAALRPKALGRCHRLLLPPVKQCERLSAQRLCVCWLSMAFCLCFEKLFFEQHHHQLLMNKQMMLLFRMCNVLCGFTFYEAQRNSRCLSSRIPFGWLMSYMVALDFRLCRNCASSVA